jgi:predicted TIM-barrel fold metal-dependent hydrolase
VKSETSKSAAIRARLNHPIIDSDGHTAEFEPALFDYVREFGGAKAVDFIRKSAAGPFSFRWHRMSWDERRAERVPRPHWWVHPSKNTLDRATSSLPKLLHERLDEMGLDFTVIYPSMGLFAIHVGDDELRPAICRAFNKLNSDLYGEFPDRMTPVAIIPMHSPREAIEELEYTVGQLKMKAILMAGYVRRPIAAAAKSPESSRWAYWLDTLALDSQYDYDPVWAKCLELKVCPSFHSPSAGTGFRATTNNFMYNHIGHFAASAEAICKSIFLGGVTRRFPELRFSFLEGGVAWAATLFADLIGHWEKHNIKTIENCDPKLLDHELMRELFLKYGERYGNRRLEPESERSELLWGTREDPADLDEWARCEIRNKEDIRDLFVPKFYFGCEGDDRLTALAFDRAKNALGCRLNALYSSDLGHFDLPDMRDAAAEAYELVEHGLITDDDFRDFVFANPVRYFTALNRDFFKGTSVEKDVDRMLDGQDVRDRPRPAA